MEATHQLESQIKRLLVERLELDQDPSEIAADSALMDDLGLDSAALLDLVAGIEEEFGIEIDSDEITEERFQTIASLTRFVGEKT